MRETTYIKTCEGHALGIAFGINLLVILPVGSAGTAGEV